MGYSYHCLGTTDVALIKQMLKMLGEAFGEMATYQDAVPDDAYLASLLAKPHFIALAATEGGEAVGGLAAYVLDKFERAQGDAHLLVRGPRHPARRGWHMPSSRRRPSRRVWPRGQFFASRADGASQ